MGVFGTLALDILKSHGVQSRTFLAAFLLDKAQNMFGHAAPKAENISLFFGLQSHMVYFKCKHAGFAMFLHYMYSE